jgi:serine/threonine-protein kinase
LPQIHGYQVLEVLGRGGMGIVYKARHHALGRTVALKMMRSGALADDREMERFAREARAAAQLQHPHLVPVYEVGVQDGLPYFSMAFVGGDSLVRQLNRYVGDPRAAAALLEKVARGVQHAHERGVLHRDLKPSNILLDERGEPLVSDFGLAKLRDAELELTQPGMVLGTPRYMAPEQATGRPDQIGPATDVWALGVILYELLTGKRPFAADSREQLLHDIQSSTPAQPRSLRPRLPRDLETICLKCLEKEPARRYASAGVLADDLKRWLAGEPILARRAAWPRRLWRTVRRHPLVSAAAVVLVLAGVAAAAWRHFSDPDRPLHVVEQQLARGQAVTLIGEKGRPAWSRLQLGESSTGLNPGDGSFFFQTDTTSLLELVPDPGLERYRFRAEVRHDKDPSWVGEAGIYFGHESYPIPSGVAHCFLSVGFTDSFLSKNVTPIGAGKVLHFTTLKFRYVQALGLKPGIGSQPFLGTRQYYELPKLRADEIPWRLLTLDVTPETIRAYWNESNKPFCVMSRREIEKYANHALSEQPGAAGLRYEFRPRSALGLYSDQSRVSFRNVVLSPLPEKN